MPNTYAFNPAIQNILVRDKFLEAAFQKWMEPEQGYDRLADVQPIEARIGESKTMTLPSLLPIITADSTAIVAGGTDLYRGLTPQQATYEQFTVTATKMRGMTVLSKEADYVKIGSEFLLNAKRLAIQAAQSLDTRAAQNLFTAYDGGNTFVTTNATASTTVLVDNVHGFRRQYTYINGEAVGEATAVSSGNALPVYIYGANGTVKYGVSTPLTVTGFTLDNPNTSTAQVGGVAFGVSGTLTLSAAVTLVAGDNIKAVDGAYVIRPNGKLTRQGLTGSDLVQFKHFQKAAGRLRNRKVPKLPNGMYAAMVDSELFTDLSDDPAFQRATATQMGVSPYFRDGIIASGAGIEFVPTSSNPIYPLATGLVARHAMVVGADALVKAPLAGSLAAARDAQESSGPVNVKITDNGIVLITRAPIDVEGDEYTQLWRFNGGYVARPDITSDPRKIPTTDFARFKRGVLIESASPS